MSKKIKNRSDEIVKMLLDRKLYKNKREVIGKALDLLVESQIIEESKDWDKQSETPEFIILSQLD